MVSTPEEVTDNSPNVTRTPTPFKKPTSRKSLFLFTNILNVKNKTSKRRVGSEKIQMQSHESG